MISNEELERYLDGDKVRLTEEQKRRNSRILRKNHKGKLKGKYARDRLRWQIHYATEKIKEYDILLKESPDSPYAELWRNKVRRLKRDVLDTNVRLRSSI